MFKNASRIVKDVMQQIVLNATPPCILTSSMENAVKSPIAKNTTTRLETVFNALQATTSMTLHQIMFMFQTWTMDVIPAPLDAPNVQDFITRITTS